MDDITASVGDKGESRHFRDEHTQSDSTRDELVEYLGTIKEEMRRIYLAIPISPC